jgi:hypothetical protein
MTDMFDSLFDLTDHQRRTAKGRYRFLLNEYRRRCYIYSLLFYTLRITMTVGSLAVPALLSLKTSAEDGDTLYWSTWAISLAVTTANGLTTLFKLDRRFFMIHAIAERLRSETWQYHALSGRYAGHYGGMKPTHKNQYVYYMTQIEKIRMYHVDEEFVRGAELADHKKPDHSTAHKKEHRRGSTAVPSPPEQPYNPTPARRDSVSTAGDEHNAVIEMADSQTGPSAASTDPPSVSLRELPRAAVPSSISEGIPILSVAQDVSGEPAVRL